MSQVPSPEKIQELKQKFSDRSLHLVEIVIAGDTHSLVMTGPSSPQWEKFTDEMLKATELKADSDKIKALRGAQLRHVLAMTQWPDRESVERFFEYHPEAVDQLQPSLREHAGASAEVRSKKL